MAAIDRADNPIEKGIHDVTKTIRIVSIVTLFLMMVFVPADVFGRYILQKPIYGDLEIQRMAMVLIVFLALPYCTFKKGQIFVELLVQRLSGRTLAIVQSIGSFAGLAIMVIITWQVGVFGMKNLLSPLGQTTELMSIPLAPFMLVATLGCAVMSLEMLIELRYAIAAVFRGKKG